MNKIENQLKWDIESNYLDGMFFNGEDECIRELNIDSATKSCYNTVKRHSIGFAKWRIGIMTDPIKNIDGKAIIRKHTLAETDYWEELFSHYLKTL